MNVLRVAILSLPLFTLPALAEAPAKPQGKPTKTHAAEAAAECHHPAEVKAAAPQQEPGWVLTRGEALKGAPSVALAELLRAPEGHEGKTVRVEGTVRKACERKGCWMELADGKDGAGMRVTFKDYGYFDPTDSAGARARVEGLVKVSKPSEAVAAHYESEGGTVPRGADGKPREVQLVASGVELRR